MKFSKNINKHYKKASRLGNFQILRLNLWKIKELWAPFSVWSISCWLTNLAKMSFLYHISTLFKTYRVAWIQFFGWILDFKGADGDIQPLAQQDHWLLVSSNYSLFCFDINIQIIMKIKYTPQRRSRRRTRKSKDLKQEKYSHGGGDDGTRTRNPRL